MDDCTFLLIRSHQIAYGNLKQKGRQKKNKGRQKKTEKSIRQQGCNTKKGLIVEKRKDLLETCSGVRTYPPA